MTLRTIQTQKTPERDYTLLAIIGIGLVVLLVVSCLRSWVNGTEIPKQSGPLGLKPSAQEIELGRSLFFDPRISADNSVSCATCHDPSKGWSDGRALAVGIRGQVGSRHTPTIIGAGYNPNMFWDSRTIGTPAQALLPMQNPIEMGQQSELQVVTKLRLIPGYVSRFAEVYGIDRVSQSPVTGSNLGRAIAAFEATVVSFDAPIDRRLDGDMNALTPDAEVGYQIFVKANCSRCHVPPLFTDNRLHNTGVEYATRGSITDRGRANVTNAAGDVAAFKTPTLREIGRSAPYMHNGQFADLKRVVRHYNFAGYVVPAGQTKLFRDGRIEQELTPLGLTETQEDYLVKFLDEAFRGSSYPQIEAPKLP